MKRFAIAIVAFALLVGNTAHAQQPMNKKKMGTGAQAGTYSSYNNFAWGIGLGGLAILGIVVGVTVGAAVRDSSFSH